MIKIQKARRGANPFDDNQPTLVWSFELFNSIKGPSDRGWLCGLDEPPLNLSGMDNFVIAKVPEGCGRRAGYYAISLKYDDAVRLTEQGRAPKWLEERHRFRRITQLSA